MLVGLVGCRFIPPQPESTATEAEALPTADVVVRPVAIVSPTPIVPRQPPTTSTISGPVTALEKLPEQPVRVTHGGRSQPFIALTFDACQSASQPAGYDEAVIHILTQTGTPATLFLGGLWMQRHPDQTQALAANPLFELGNHSWSHADFSQLTAAEMNEEIERTQKLIISLTGQRPVLFRFPYDIETPEGLAVIDQHRLRAIGADVITGDPDPQVSARAIVKTVTSQAQNGSIIIMHMNTWGWRTAEALPAVIEQLHEQGYTFVTVSQLLETASAPNSSNSGPFPIIQPKGNWR
jgi:peptidoglycan/xylan/chitin deacetylase (PgdA/CDA1 family)